MKDDKLETIIKNCNSNFAKKIYLLWRSEPKKIFFYLNNKSYNGLDIVNIINKKIKIINKYKNKKPLIFIKNKNSLDWVILYIAGKIINAYIFIIPLNTNIKKLNFLKKIFCPNFIFINDKIKLLSLDKNKITNVAKQKKIKLGSNKIYDFLFTTGSTNTPKGVCIEEKAYLHTANNLVNIFKQNKKDCELLSMSFSHSFGLTRLRCCLITGQKIYITSGLKDFPKIYSNLDNFNVNAISLVPAAISVIKALLRKQSKKFASKIKYMEIGSSSMNMDLRVWLKANFVKTKIMHHYGSTEASRSFFAPRGKEDNLSLDSSWIGDPAKGIKFKLKRNEKTLNTPIGELYIKGPNLSLGYICGDNHEGKSTFEKWYKTKDLVVTKNKKVFLKGRLSSFINIGGEKILAEEIEEKLEQIKEIEKALCGSVNDDIFGERVGALISLKKNFKNKNSEFSNKIKKKLGKLPYNQQLKKIKFVNKIPITTNGKKNRNRDLFNDIISNEEL